MSNNKDAPQNKEPNQKTMDGDARKQVAQKTQMSKEELNKEIIDRIKDFEVKKIRKMTYSQIVGIQDFKEAGRYPENLPNKKAVLREADLMVGKSLQEYSHLQKTPSEQVLQQIKKSQLKRAMIRRESFQTPIWAQIKRGRLGVDNFFIAFAILGGIMLPLFFYDYWEKRRKIVIESRIASPQVIKHLDQHSPISLDDVSVHTIHYYNPDRERERKQERKKYEQFEQLKKDLDF